MREYKFRAWNGETMVYPSLDGHGQINSGWIISNYETVMQFTGLKDLQGKEVYEGDIVDYGNGRNKVVEFIDGCFCICGITAMPKLMTLYPVIGNIYENPELLK